MPWDSLGHTRSRSSPPSNDPKIACPGTAKIAPSPALAGLPKLPDTFSIKVILIFSAETLQARSECQDIFKGLKRKKLSTKNTLRNKIIIRTERERSSQTRKTKGIYLYSGLSRNVKGLSLVEEKR